MRTIETTVADLLGDPTFVEREVLPALYGPARPERAPEYRFRLVDVEDSTKISAEYRLEGGTTLFAKVYSGADEDGAHTLQVLRALWEGGFGEGSRYQVSEPVAYLPHRRVLITRGVPGVCLEEHLGSNSAEQFEGVREAARWLARLHEAPLRIGRPWNVWQNFYRLGHRLTKAAARRPDYATRLHEMLERLAGMGHAAEAPPRLVQTHGQFRDLHVFLTGQAGDVDRQVGVIDFDRSLPADPAKDLDEFLHRLRWKTFKHTRDEADALTAAFLEEYAAAGSPEDLANLPFYWGYHALYSLARFVRSKEPGHPDWDEVTAFYAAEFETAVTGRLAGLIGGR